MVKVTVNANPSGYIDPKKMEETYVEQSKRILEETRSVHGDGEARSDGWMNVLTGTGICGRDKKQNGFFRLTNIFNRSELDQMYRSDGVLRLIIDLFAQEMVRQGWELEGDVQGKIVGKLEELKVNLAITNLIKWARLFGGAVCIMGIADGLPLDQPVDEAALRDVQWLRVFDRYQCYSRDGTFESDLNSPNYGFPNVYTVNDNRTGAVFYVHYSRILRMDWNVLPPRWQNFNQGWGDPLVQTVYEELRNYSMAFSATATMFDDFVNKVLYIPNLSGIIASQCGEEQVAKRLNILNLTQSNMNTTVLDADEKYEKISTNFNGIHELLDRFMIALSAVTRIPVTLLFGRSPAGLNSTGESDVRNFYDAVKQEQESKLRGCLEKLIRYIMISKDGPFNGEEPEDWSLQFIPLWQNTEEQDALTRKAVADTDAVYIDRGVLTPEEVAISRFGGNKWSMNTEIDMKQRERMSEYPEELEELEEEKEGLTGLQPTEGPDYMGTGLPRSSPAAT
jgi:hypothetical protein